MRKRYGVIGLFVVVGSLAGCAGSAPAAPGAATQASHTATAPTATASAAAPICGELSEPASLAFTAADDFQKGSIDETERNSRLIEAARLFDQIDAAAEPGLSSAIASVNQYIDAAEPDATGQPYDAASGDFSNLLSGLGLACEKAGSELTVSAHGG